MTTINLLPWRQRRREAQKKQFYLLLASLFLCCIFVLGNMHFWMEHQIDLQLKSNQFIEQQIKNLDEKLEKIKNIQTKKKQLLSRMRVIQDLQKDRPNVVHLFNDLVKIVPDGLTYHILKRENKLITIEGFAESNTRVSKLMRNIKDSSILINPELQIIREQDAQQKIKDVNLGNFRYFNMLVQQVDRKG